MIMQLSKLTLILGWVQDVLAAVVICDKITAAIAIKLIKQKEEHCFICVCVSVCTATLCHLIALCALIPLTRSAD
jgi:hypothetical protein